MNIYFRNSCERAFGTWPLTGQVLAEALANALAVGYRAIDTAQMYENEADVGEALQHGGVERSRLCITTKVHPANYGEASFLPSVEESLGKLRIDQVDVLLLHWPPPDGGDVAPVLRLLERAQRTGLAKHVGVSNFSPEMMEQAARAVDVPLIVNQIEFHPLLDPSPWLRAAHKTGIPLASYCSLARGEVFKHGLFEEIGNAYLKTPAQVVLRWILQKGVPINTMSTRRANMEANFQVMDFTLSSVDMARIDAMAGVGHRVVAGFKR